MSVQVVVMGVSGAGKTTIGTRLAHHLGVDFLEGDSLHSAKNIDKMQSGRPLTDEEREPWLAAIGERVAAEPALVVACSALKRSYRDFIRRSAPTAVFIHLDCPRSVIESRLADRSGHFMPVELLKSQLDILEPLEADEVGFTVEAIRSPEEVVTEMVRRLAELRLR